MIIHLIIAFFAFILLVIINFAVLKKVFPFSNKFEAVKSSESLVTLLVSFGSILILLIIHLLVSKNFVLSFIFLSSLVILDLILWKFVFNISKDKLKS